MRVEHKLYVYIALIKYPIETNEGKKDLYSWKVQSTMVELVQQQEGEKLDTLHP